MQAELLLRIQVVAGRVKQASWHAVLAGKGGFGGSRQAGWSCYVLQPYLPYGLAHYWAEHLNRAWMRERDMSPSRGRTSKRAVAGDVLRWWLDWLDEDLQMWQRRDVDLLRPSEEDRRTSRLQLRVVLRPGSCMAPREDALAPSISWSALGGRSLLLSELERWLLRSGVPIREGDIYTDDWGRALQRASDLGQVELTSGIRLHACGRLTCSRCGADEAALHWRPCASCGYFCPYCEQCLQLGRVRLCSPLVRSTPGHMQGRQVHLDKRISVSSSDSVSTFDLGKWSLSPAQQDAVEQGLRFLMQTEESLQGHSKQAEPPSFLLWAVTGAGKTEMVYPLIDRELTKGGRVLVAAPRRDVVMELKPRLERAFPHCRVIALYGGSEDTWKEGDLVLATTHQLLRYDRAFDLAIIDELDAFPFHNNPMLHYAASRSLAEGGRRILLSATPTVQLKRAVRRNKLPHALVYVRYHRHPLPVPRLLRTPPLAKWLKASIQKREPSPYGQLAHWLGDRLDRMRCSLPRALFRAMQISLRRGAQLFVFVPRIADAEPTARLLRAVFQDARVESVHAQDGERTAKVDAFRRGEIRILVTTTILERGVTVPRTDVFILDAHRSPFDATSLVQMAGRAGRSGDDPAGRVVFAAPSRNLAQVRAMHEIRRMNRWARRKGYLLRE